MKPSKLHILIWFLKLRYSRYFNSNRIGKSRKMRLKKTLSNSPYYQAYSTNVNLAPVINKQGFMQHFDEINTVGIRKEDTLKLAQQSERTRDFSPMIDGISIGLSSGTSGNKGIFLTSKREKAIWVAAVLDRVIGFSLKSRKVAFFLRANNNLYESVKSKSLSFSFFDIKDSVEKHMDRLIALSPDILVAQPSVLNQIAKVYVEKRVTPSFKKVISVAEVLESDQKIYFQEAFNCRIDQVYQCTEGFLAFTCSEGKLHFNEDWLLIEKAYLDESKTRFHPIITDYLRSSQPVVRYELNDIIHEGSICTCGSKSTVIDRIEGRSDDVFIFKNGKDPIIIYPDFIRRSVISASDEIKNYFVRMTSNTVIEVSLELYDNGTEEVAFESVKQQLNSTLGDFGISGVEIRNIAYKHDPMMKFTRIKNASA